MNAPQNIELEIDRLGGRADGIGKDQGQKIYVPFTAPGDRVRVRLGEIRDEGISAKLIEVLTAGPDRVEPPCPYFLTCGGCSVQHLAPKAEQVWKRQLVVDALGRRGFGEETVAETLTVPLNSRRRTTFTVVNAGGRILLGYLARGSHRVVPVQSCDVLDPSLSELIQPLAVLAHDLPISKKGLNISLTKTTSGLDVVIGGRKELTLELRERLASFARQHDLARLSWGAKHPEPVVAQRLPSVEFGGVAVEPVPGGFLQASAAAEAILTEHVADHLSGCEELFDLFAGVGTFALALASRGARVTAYDGDDAAVVALTGAVNRSAGRISVTAQLRDLERNSLTPDELKDIDGVVLDPPRAGAKGQCADLASSGIRKISYVSCAPGTFARDARKLVDGGYALKSVVPINQFPWSSHVELIGCFERV
jgi:23S rRNA (uracil1939-C5)-methyltransferase